MKPNVRIRPTSITPSAAPSARGRAWGRTAMIGCAVSALMLITMSACGYKGPLVLPKVPSHSAQTR